MGRVQEDPPPKHCGARWAAEEKIAAEERMEALMRSAFAQETTPAEEKKDPLVRG